MPNEFDDLLSYLETQTLPIKKANVAKKEVISEPNKIEKSSITIDCFEGIHSDVSFS
jgi:hypothetical protein